jgi:type I restriction enzyme S subunit
VTTANIWGGEGVLPKGWRWVRLGEVCYIRGGKRLPKGQTFANEKTKYPYLRVVDFVNGTVRTSNLQYLTEDTQKEIARYIIHSKDVYISIAGSIGIIGTIPHELDGANLTENAARLVIKDAGIVDNQYISAFLKSPFGQRHIDIRTNQVGQPKLALERIATIEIPLPSLAEQKRIVSILNEQMAAVEKARLAAEARLAAARALTAAYLRKVFQNPEKKGWRWVKVGDVCEKQTGTKDPRVMGDKLFRYVDISSIDNVLKCIIEARSINGSDAPSRARQIILKDDVLIATTRPNLNAVAIVPPELDGEICSTGFCVLRAKENLLPDYLFAFVQYDAFIIALIDLVKGALYPAVTDSQVKSQSIPLPPTLNEQEYIARIIKEQMAVVDKIKQTLRQELETINTLPAALLRQAITGGI